MALGTTVTVFKGQEQLFEAQPPAMQMSSVPIYVLFGSLHQQFCLWFYLHLLTKSSFMWFCPLCQQPFLCCLAQRPEMLVSAMEIKL